MPESITKQQEAAHLELEATISKFYAAIKPTAKEVEQAQDWVILEANLGATDYQVALFAYRKRRGEL